MKPRLVATDGAPPARWRPSQRQVGAGFLLVGAAGWIGACAMAETRVRFWMVASSEVFVFVAAWKLLVALADKARFQDGGEIVRHVHHRRGWL